MLPADLSQIRIESVHERAGDSLPEIDSSKLCGLFSRGIDRDASKTALN